MKTIFSFASSSFAPNPVPLGLAFGALLSGAVACSTDVLVPVGGAPSAADGNDGGLGDGGRTTADDGGAGGPGGPGAAEGPVVPSTTCEPDEAGGTVMLCRVSPTLSVVAADAAHVVVAAVDTFGTGGASTGRLRLLRLERTTNRADQIFVSSGSVDAPSLWRQLAFAADTGKLAFVDTVDVSGGFMHGLRVFDVAGGTSTTRAIGDVTPSGGVVSSPTAFYFDQASGQPGLAGDALRRMDAVTGATSSLGVNGRPLLAAAGRLYYEARGAGAQGGAVWSVADDGAGAREELVAPASRWPFAIDGAGRRFVVEPGDQGLYFVVARVETDGARTPLFRCTSPDLCTGGVERLRLANGRLFVEWNGVVASLDPDAGAARTSGSTPDAYLRGSRPWYEATRLLQGVTSRNPNGFIEGLLVATPLPTP